MIAIIDYGMGNLASVYNAFLKTGCDPKDVVITSDPGAVRDAQKLVLPGVGAFEDAIRNLDRGGLSGPIRDSAAKGRPFLGICLGFHLIFSKGYENGCFDGLGLLRGDVVRFDIPLPVPHMGWNTASFARKEGIFAQAPDTAYFYFDHSYYPQVGEEGIAAAYTEYGIRFVSAVSKGNVFGAQFHPEKSHDKGLELIRAFSRFGS